MKFLLTTILSILVAYISGAFLPWWTFTILLALIHAFLNLKPSLAFLSGFIALFILWGTLSLIMDISNHHILSKKIALLFIQQESYGYIILITAFLGALLGGLSALTGSLAKRIMTIR